MRKAFILAVHDGLNSVSAGFHGNYTITGLNNLKLALSFNLYFIQLKFNTTVMNEVTVINGLQKAFLTRLAVCSSSCVSAEIIMLQKP